MATQPPSIRLGYLSLRTVERAPFRAQRPTVPFCKRSPHTHILHRPHTTTRSHSKTPPPPHPSLRPLPSLLGGRATLYTLLALLVSSTTYLYITDTRASLHSWLISPLLRLLHPSAEAGHAFGITALKNLYALGLHPRERSSSVLPSTTDTAGAADATLAVDLFGHTLQNPIAISAGLDKNGEAISPLFALGPALLEIGGVTPQPQEGNERPRVWRVPSQQAIVNRYGLNNVGADAVALNLRARVRAFADKLGYGVGSEGEERVPAGEAGVPPGSLEEGKLLAVQIAKNKVTPDEDLEAVVQDHVTCVRKLGPYADIIVVNVSSPNTAGLRDLQRFEPLHRILKSVVGACQEVPRREKPRVMVKVSPDENAEKDIQGICRAVWLAGVDGVVVANTTKSRPSRDSPNLPANPLAPLPSAEERRALSETGGYSGPALFPQTLRLVKEYRKMLDMPLREVPDAPPKVIFASGGICTGEDALKVLREGASVAMVYTALSYRGSGFVTEMKGDMRRLIKEEGQTK